MIISPYSNYLIRTAELLLSSRFSRYSIVFSRRRPEFSISFFSKYRIDILVDNTFFNPDYADFDRYLKMNILTKNGEILKSV